MSISADDEVSDQIFFATSDKTDIWFNSVRVTLSRACVDIEMRLLQSNK